MNQLYTWRLTGIRGLCSTDLNTHISQQDTDHAYYTSKIYGPGDAAGKELWVNLDETEEEGEWKVHGFLSSAHRQAEVKN